MNRLISRVGITMGDYNGIGPEVTIKALKELTESIQCQFVIIGSAMVYQSLQKLMHTDLQFEIVNSIDELEESNDYICIYDPFKDFAIEVLFGELSSKSGHFAAESLIMGIDFARKGIVDAIVTSPINKKAFDLAGYSYPGQTEILAEKTGTANYAMMLISEKIRVGLVTTHCAISEVSGKLSRQLVTEKISIINQSLIQDFKIEKPVIAVTSLNPHSGEDGLFGSEENRIILPALEEMKEKGVDVHGPFSADTLFARINRACYDVYITMYHDQGLIPLKMYSFGKGVNFTAGLPIIRTSPDHGTAFDIAGQNNADSGSMKEAIRLAYELVQKRVARSSI